MSKQHYIPAAYIGNFSSKKLERNRESKIWVKRRSISIPYTQKAENVGYKKDLYVKSVDNIWKHVEDRLIIVIEKLIEGYKSPISADMWIIMVRFIAQLFVRGFEFNSRYKDRMETMFNGKLDAKYYEPHIDFIRLFELQRIYAPIMYAEWVVWHNNTNKSIITNDLGFCLMFDNVTKKNGYAIPLDTNSVLSLTISDRTIRRRVPAENINNKWYVTSIIHRELDEKDLYGLNNSVSGFCLNEIYGPNKESVDYNLPEDRPTNFATEPDYLIPLNDSEYLMKCELDLFKFMSIIGQNL